MYVKVKTTSPAAPPVVTAGIYFYPYRIRSAYRQRDGFMYLNEFTDRNRPHETGSKPLTQIHSTGVNVHMLGDQPRCGQRHLPDQTTNMCRSATTI